MLDGIFPWSAPVAGLPVALSVAIARQYLSGFLIGCGVGGVVGASTLGVAMFSLSAATGRAEELHGRGTSGVRCSIWATGPPVLEAREPKLSA